MGNIVNGSGVVWAAMQAKSIKMVTSSSPLEPSPCWLDDGRKKFKVKSIKICHISTIFRGRFEGRLIGQKSSKSNKPYDKVLGAAQFIKRTSISCPKLSKVVNNCQ